MTIQLPDPDVAAREIIDRARNNREQYINGPTERVIADTPWADPDVLFSGFLDYHHERLSRIPSPEKYPEARPWVEHRLAVEQELIAAGLSDWDRAVLGGLNDYLSFRGYRMAAKKRRSRSSGGFAPNTIEKCRVAYLPETDEGAVFIKNADDPATFWRKDRTGDSFRQGLPTLWQSVRVAGVGSGLHLDLEPEEIFPLPILQMRDQLCDDLPSTLEFLTRYSDFHSGYNFIVFDNKKRSVAVEKCSRSHIEVFEPAVEGRSFVSGMVCRDSNSPQARHQRAMREEYIELSGSRWDAKESFEVAFWEACDLAERILADFLNDPKPVTADALLNLFITPFPRGLRKDGAKFHPNQPYIEYTLITYMALIDNRRAYRFQCDDPPGLEWPEEPEVYNLGGE